MKTVPLSEVLKQCTKGPIEPVYLFRSDPRGYPALKTLVGGRWIAKTDCSINTDNWVYKEDEATANAALLAHFYNLGPELVCVLTDLVRANEALLVALKQNPEDNLTLIGARGLLSHANSVQIP